MKHEIKQLWLDALKSGEYKQGKGNLKLTKAGQRRPPLLSWGAMRAFDHPSISFLCLA